MCQHGFMEMIEVGTAMFIHFWGYLGVLSGCPPSLKQTAREPTMELHWSVKHCIKGTCRTQVQSLPCPPLAWLEWR